MCFSISVTQLRGLALGGDERSVNSVFLKQFIMRSDFRYPAFFNNDKTVGVSQGGETVGDGECSSAFDKLRERSTALAIEILCLSPPESV